MNKKIIPLALFLATSASYAQVGIGTLNPEATTQLDVVATDKGVLIPRVQLVASTNPAPITKGNSVAAEAGDLTNGLLVYNTVASNDLKPGFHFWKDGAWMRLVTPVDVQEAIDAAGDNDTKITAFTLAEGVLRITVQNGANPSSSFDVPVSDLAVALGKDLTVDESLEITAGGTGAVLVATNIKVKNGGITTDHIADGTVGGADLADGAVTPDKLNAGTEQAGLIPVSNPDGTVSYSPTIPQTALPANGNGTLTGSDQILVENGTGALLHDASVSIKPDSIGADQIATGAVTTDEILDGTVAAVDLAAGSVTPDKMSSTTAPGVNVPAGQVPVSDGNGGVTYGTLPASSVTGEDLTAADATIVVTDGVGAVLKATNLKVGTDAITADHIAPDAITASELADNAVDNAAIAADAVTTDKIQNGTIKPEDMLGDAANDGKVLTTVNGVVEWTTPTVDATQVQNAGTISSPGTITVTGGDASALKDVTLEVAANAITAEHIATGAVTTDEILDGTVAAADLAAGSVTPDKLNSGSTQAGLVPVSNADGTVTYSPTIPQTALPTDGNGTLTGSDQILVENGAGALLHDASVSIKPDSIGADQIATGAVTTDEILNGTIKPEDILGEAANNNKVLTTVDGAVQWADNPAVINYTKNEVATTTGTVVIDGTTYKIKRVVKVVPINTAVLGSGTTAIGANRAFTLADLGLNATTAAQILNFRANGNGHTITEFKVVGENLALTSGNISKAYPTGNYTVIIEFYEQ